MSNLSVNAFYIRSGSYPEDKLELKGIDKTDAPRDATLYFENNVTGNILKSFSFFFQNRNYRLPFEYFKSRFILCIYS